MTQHFIFLRNDNSTNKLKLVVDYIISSYYLDLAGFSSIDYIPFSTYNFQLNKFLK